MPPLVYGSLIAFICFIIAITCANQDNTTGMWLALIGTVASLILTAYLQRRRESNVAQNQFNKLEHILNSIPDFKSDHTFISPVADSMIAIDETNKKVLLIENKHVNAMHFSKTTSKYDYLHKLFSFDDVLQVEMLEDGVTVNKTSATSQIGRAALGGLIAGGVGAIIGGLSGESVSSQKIKKAQLKVIVNNKEKSFYTITFIHFDEPQSKENEYYKPLNDRLIHCFNLLTHILKKDANKNTHSNGVADELTKLAALYKDNLLTHKEYESQKKKLLS
ncbi:SHOCT domain-containing protein [Bacillus atrophaeus]|uniref:SHOCT domain-containing protein n=1 Tax=Bacillus atrophaeus TaxID=1452 RepID=UPI00227E8BC5|nr:SHOCT domain-containing protein [Bacillus atrophaeus]MCY8911043.1 SHOCT domain-containing protein [Bacillus atrophaeus]MEC0836374.1 SHOCT domain-containing protein [Bacillus atrophaeus]MEC0846576.1 SHOCT domain-containing protein [Bacillus atrophaeus]MEC0850874.1 SHOCT domain-containing protein [Bacillus atrophaeus]MEC0867620.1 SHOCT domain-containing protein [Bacillus atrophaeus]